MNVTLIRYKYYILQVFMLIQLSIPVQVSYASHEDKIIVGSERTETYLPLLKGKKVGLLVNHTSYIGQTHLVDSLLSLQVNVLKIFAPEHGFRGNVSNGEEIKDSYDVRTGLKVISLYGKNKKPSSDQLKGIDIIIYDIQDVGARFYTYISTMHYMMEACAEQNIQFLLFDRPNPNGHYVDGPTLENGYESFVGKHTIPIVYGMTAGELAQMIIGEKWINGSDNLQLTVIPNKGWKRKDRYSLPIPPSPNLPNDKSINLYPSLCLFEGTKISVGRGTSHPFQVIGFPGDDSIGSYTFRPVSLEGYSKYPKHESKLCYGRDLRLAEHLERIDLSLIISMYQKTPENFFNSFFEKLSGTDQLRKQIESGMTEEQIRSSWNQNLSDFKKLRSQYLIYPDS